MLSRRRRSRWTALRGRGRRRRTPRQAAQRHYTALADDLDAVVWEADAQTFRFAFVSQYAEVLLGYPVAQWWTEPGFWRDHLYGEDREQTIRTYRDRIAAGHDFQCAYRLVAAAGHAVWVQARVRLVKDAQGQVRQLRGLLVDLTTQQRDAQTVPARLAPYSTWFEAHPHPMWVYDRETLAFLAVNDAAVAQYGYTREEFLALTLKDMRPPEDVPALLANVAQTTASYDAPDRWRHRTKDGRLLDVELTSHAVTYAGRPARVVLAQDITARTQAEDALARRIAQLHAVQTIAQEITREIDLSTLLTLLVDRAVALLGAARSVLYLWQEETQRLHPRAWCNAGEWLSTLTLRLGEGVAGTVAQRREGLIVNDYRQSPAAHPTFLAHFGSVPVIAEPLLYRDRLVGVLVVTHGAPGPGFAPPDRELLAVFAAQATIAIENARLFEESGRRQAWLSRILAMNTRLATSADLPSLLARITETAARLVGADGANLRLLHGDRLVTTRETQFGLVLPHAPALRLGEGIVGVAARDNRVIVVPDLQIHPEIPAFIKAQAAEVGLHALVSLPIQSRRRVIGVLAVNSARPRVFSADECAALASCAEQAAIAIEHTQLVDAVTARQAAVEHANAALHQEVAARQLAEAALARRMAQLHTVQTIAEELTRELDLSTVLTLIAHRAAALVEATRSVLYLWDEATHTLQPRAWDNASAWVPQVSLRLEEGVAGTVAQRREGLIVNDYQQSPYAHPLVLAHLGAAPIIAEPLLYRDRLVGVLVVMRGAPGPGFTPPDRAPLAVLATHATIAIENVRLFADSARRQAWLATILDMNKRIAAHEDMASLCTQVAEGATRLVGADGTILRMLQGDQLVTVGATPYGPTAADAPAARLGEGIVGRAALEQRVLMISDVQAHPDIAPDRKQRAAEAGIHAMLCVPVCGRDQVLGVLSVTSRHRRVFTNDETMVLTAYAEQVAIAIEQARLLAAEGERTAVVERTNRRLREEIAERQRVEAERERLIAELEAKTAEMERFTYTVSHDLKSPLITIQGFLGLLEQDALAGNRERLRTDMAHIQTAAATMQRLLHELLELSRIGRVVNPRTVIPLSNLAREAVLLVGGQIAAREVQVQMAADLPVVVGDRPRLLEVLQNLVDNAVKFLGAQPQPRIEIGMRVEGEEPVYYVRDNGVGVEPRYHEQIFGLFERLDAASEGTGIGLALVKRIIEVHGGRIWVESAGLGHGSTFCFTLPSGEPSTGRDGGTH